MFSLIAPLARQATWFIPALALAGFLAARPGVPAWRWPPTASWPSLRLFHLPHHDPLRPSVRPRPGRIRPADRHSPGPGGNGADRRIRITGPPWNFTPGAISSWSSATACPSFPTRCPALGLPHHPGTPAGAVAGTPKSLSAPGQRHPAGAFPPRRHRGLDPAEQAPAGQPSLRFWRPTRRAPAAREMGSPLRSRLVGAVREPPLQGLLS